VAKKEKKLPRLKFKCWNCERTYTLLPSEITEEQKLIVPCPYCDAEAVVKVEPFKKRVMSVARRRDEEGSAIGFEYDFPEVIPTENPGQS